MKIIAVSDMHGRLPTIPECDLLLIAGDICSHGSTHSQLFWLRKEFRIWLDQVPAKEIVAVAGNHDWVFQKQPGQIPKFRWHYLLDRSIELNGLVIHGSPWQPIFYDWAFNLSEEELAEKFALIPDNADIVVTHGPPLGFRDETPSGLHVGSSALRRRIDQVQPALHVFGHIHHSHGTVKTHDSSTLFANVSVVDEDYAMVHNPTGFQLRQVTHDPDPIVSAHPNVRIQRHLVIPT